MEPLAGLTFGAAPVSLQLLSVIAAGGVGALGLFALARMMVKVRARDLRHLGQAASKEPILVALRPVLERLAFLATLLPQEGHAAWARKTLLRANLIQMWSPALIETMKLAAAIVVFFGGLLLCLVLSIGIPWILLGMGTIAAYFVPDLMLLSYANGRQANMRKSLPFVIDLIAVSAEAGLAFQQAIQNVVTNSRAGSKSTQSGEAAQQLELIDEFENLLNNLKMGRTMAEALNEAAARVGLDEFKTFVNSILQAEQLGTPVSETLKNQSKELRVKLAARMEAKANQAPVKILFPLIIFIFPVTGWIIIGPVLLRVFFGQG